SKLTTEQINSATTNIDKCSTLEMVRLINDEDKKISAAVEKVLPQIANAVDLIANKLSSGGRLIYIGAGTSGRLGVLDASECPPTFGVTPELVQGIIAGGNVALTCAVEGAEDDVTAAIRDLEEKNFSAKDVLAGIAASGRTPYVLGGIDYAKKISASTVGISCVENSALAKIVDIAITPITGAEVITGSTRMKAGTATKMVLNMLTTGAMIRLGKVYGNLMVDVHATNDKLRDRAKRIVMTATNCTEQQALDALEKFNGHAKNAILGIKKLATSN
ncbi:MAG: N-acetylmuramic acid 6-phosphate etherase, partial [Selenomonadaceae bacterium]|nr:N-acetylmuramic acid 6-phosphate etherase [Selenomonadaceae bacterium]